MFKYIRQNQQMSVLIAGVFFVIAIVIGWMSLSPSGPPKVTKAFFTVDEGKSWFVGDVETITPFDVDGKPAVRAYLFRCPGKGVYCGLLSRHIGGAEKKTVEPSQSTASGNRSQSNPAKEFKKPGQSQWIDGRSMEMVALAVQKCADGTEAQTKMP